MSPLARLRAAGFHVTARGDKVVISPRGRLTDELRAWIRAHKPALLAELGQSGNQPSAVPAPSPSEAAQEAARRDVLERLRADPRITRAFATRWEGDVLVVTLAVRGVGTCELAIPADRLTDPADYARLLATLEGHA